MTNHEAYISEIFSSLQGEGPYAGTKMTFVRFTGCSVNCQWCDTDNRLHRTCKIYTSQDLTSVDQVINPIGIAQLDDIIGQFTSKVVSITGGEPLEQVDFLTHFLPTLHQKRTILLETNGILPMALQMISDHIDIISMDIKVPSSTGRKAFWSDHKRFLTTALKMAKEIYVKLVVTSSVTDRDINNVIRLVSTTNRHIPIIIQPATPTQKFHHSVSTDRVLSFKRLLGAWLPNVSVVPQMHKQWGMK